MYSATPTQARRAQTVLSLNVLNAERRSVPTAEHGAAGNHSVNHVAITT
jgi:hypothetical protein